MSLCSLLCLTGECVASICLWLIYAFYVAKQDEELYEASKVANCEATVEPAEVAEGKGKLLL